MVAVLIVAHVHPMIASAAAFVAGAIAGMATGTLHTRFRINGLLAGILVMTALYSVNLHVMGRSNVPLMQARTFATFGESLGKTVVTAKDTPGFIVNLLLVPYLCEAVRAVEHGLREPGEGRPERQDDIRVPDALNQLGVARRTLFVQDDGRDLAQALDIG